MQLMLARTYTRTRLDGQICVSPSKRGRADATFFSFMRRVELLTWLIFTGKVVGRVNCIFEYTCEATVPAGAALYMPASVYRVIPVPSHEADMVCALPHRVRAMLLILPAIHGSSPSIYSHARHSALDFWSKYILHTSAGFQRKKE